MRRLRQFPWNTLATLGLGTYGLVHLTMVWWWGWTPPFKSYFPGEQYVNGTIIHLGLTFLGWRWLVLARALWDRWTP